MQDVLTDEERDMYQAGVVDCLRGREPLTWTLVLAGRDDLQIHYIRGWLVGERLLVDDEPEELDDEQYD